MSAPPPGRQAAEILQSARGWARVEAVALRILDDPHANRPRALDELCLGDDEFREAVERIVRSLEESDGFLESPAVRHLLTSGAGGADLMAMLRPPARLGRYRLVRRLGVGGMGSVWLGENGDRRRPVAVKWLPPFVDRDTRKRFDNEQRTLAMIRHPNVVRFVDGGTGEDGHPYLVTEYVDGVQIDVYCAQRGLSLVRRLDLISDLCAALEAIHRHGLVHRDLKPANVLVTLGGEVKVVDFGIVRSPRSIHGFESSLTRTGTRPMTPGYASPEQVTGQEITPATDVHGVGLLLYELATGRRAYAREGSSVFEVEQEVRAGAVPRPSSSLTPQGEVHVEMRGGDLAGLAPPEPPHALRHALRRHLDPVVLRCLAKSPDQRFASARQLAGAVDRACRDIGREGRTLGRLRQVWPVALIAMAALFLWGAAERGPRLTPDPGVERQLNHVLTKARDSIRERAPIALIPLEPADDGTALMTARAVDHELRRRLEGLPGARLVGTISSERVATMDLDLATAASYLHALYVLEGDVSGAAEAPRVRLRAVRAADGMAVFESEFYAFEDDLLPLMVDLAAALQLRPPDRHEVENTLGPWRLDVAEQVAIYSTIRFIGPEMVKRDVARRKLFRALELDPESPRARLELARNGALLRCTPGRLPARVGAMLDELASRYPDYHEVWTVTALYRLGQRDPQGAVRALAAAVERGGGRPEAMQRAVLLALSQGRIDLAKSFADLMLEVDPLSVRAQETTASLLLRTGEDERAVQILRDARSYAPEFRLIFTGLAQAQLLAGRREAAQRAADREFHSGFRLYAQALAHDPKSPTDEALQRLITERGHDMAYQVAQVYAQRGDRRQTLHWLELAEARGDCGLLNAPTDRWLRAFSDEPRFREVLTRFGLALPTS